MPTSPEFKGVLLGYFKKMEALRYTRLEGYEHIDPFSSEQLERCDRLDEIPRYSSIEQMTHRGTVGAHALRVTALTFFATDMLLNLGVELDQPKAVFLADHHDDTEIPDMEDIPSPVKRKAKGRKKKELEEKEREAVGQVEHLIEKPQGVESYREAYEEYRAQRTLETKVVNYMDKWDGLHEAVHEVVCGENKIAFRRVIEEYRPVFDELNRVNESWQKVAGLYLGDDLFTFPDPDKIVPKTPADLDWSTAQNLMKSIAQGLRSYMFWLMTTQHVFKHQFLVRAFPGWLDYVPLEVWDDIERVRLNNPYKTTNSGLLVPSGTIDPDSPTFGESLNFELLKLIIDGRGAKIRMKNGFKKARGRYYNMQQYLDE